MVPVVVVVVVYGVGCEGLEQVGGVEPYGCGCGEGVGEHGGAAWGASAEGVEELEVGWVGHVAGDWSEQEFGGKGQSGVMMQVDSGFVEL